MKTKHFFAGRLALLGTAFIWGTSFVVLKSTLDCMGTLWVLSIRFIISALLLGLLSGKRLFRMPRHIFRGSILMGLCIVSAYIFQTYGLKYTSPGKNAFLTATYVVIVPFLSWAVHKIKPGASKIISAFLCIIGIGLVSLGSADASGLNKGDVLTIFCGFFYAVQIIVMEICVGEGDALPISAVQFATSAVVCTVLALIFEPVPHNVPPSAWLSIAYLSVLCTGGCFYLQAWGLQYTPAPTASVIMVFESVFGAVISVIFYHEQISFRLFAGFFFIFLSVLTAEVGHFMWQKAKKLLNSNH